MAAQLHVIDLETCTGDAICADVCPENALELVNEKTAIFESRSASAQTGKGDPG
jgi:formate hydrogenlyase subunit 6/NADH:ubiquinone oxidoreductase subunit I